MSIYKSEHDGMDLPRVWNNFTSDQKLTVIRYLNGHTGHRTLPKAWLYDMTTPDRRRVRRHLELVGSVEVREMPRSTTSMHVGGVSTGRMSPFEFPYGTEVRNPSHVKDAMDYAMGGIVKSMHQRGLSIDMSDIERRIMMGIEKSVTGGMLYAKPNGGHRMLPSGYTQLRTYWIRGSGQKQLISTMNEGHLGNTLKLLKESHGNVVGRSTQLLGKMHRHFGNQPTIQAKLIELLKLMEQVEVDQMYPIFGTLAQELASRKIDIDIEEFGFDDIMKDW